MKKFNSNNLDSIKEMIEYVNEVGIIFGETDKGEDIFFDLEKIENKDVLVTTVLQHNGVERINRYYIDGTVEIEYCS